MHRLSRGTPACGVCSFSRGGCRCCMRHRPRPLTTLFPMVSRWSISTRPSQCARAPPSALRTPLLRGRGTPQRVRAAMRRRQRRALPDHPCRMNIPASPGRRPLGSSWPLKSDCPLECVRACRVYTGCRRDVDQGRRQIGIDVWIDGKTVRASRAHVPDHLCRCSHSLTAATVRRPRRPILWAGRAAAIESPAPRGAGPIGPVPRGADPARFGR